MRPSTGKKASQAQLLYYRSAPPSPSLQQQQPWHRARINQRKQHAGQALRCRRRLQLRSRWLAPAQLGSGVASEATAKLPMPMQLCSRCGTE